MDTLYTPANKTIASRDRLCNLGAQLVCPYRPEQIVASIPSGSSFTCIIVLKTDTSPISSSYQATGRQVKMRGAAVRSGAWASFVGENAGVNDPDDFSNFGDWGLIPYTRSDPTSASFAQEDGSAGETSAFLDTVYDLARSGKEELAIDVIFEYMNGLLVQGKFGTCDRILAEVDIGRIPPVLMVSFLTITAAAAPRLKNRRRFHQFVRALVARERGEKAAERLLDGLE